MAKVFANLVMEDGRVYVKEYRGIGDAKEQDFNSFDDAINYALLRGFSIKTESQWATGCSMWFEAIEQENNYATGGSIWAGDEE